MIWVNLGVLEGVLRLLGGLGGHLGPSWRSLGGSWRPVGASWVLLGGLRPACVHFCRFKLNRARWGAELVPIWEPKTDPKRHPKCIQIEDKIEDENKSLSKTVLERS